MGVLFAWSGVSDWIHISLHGSIRLATGMGQSVCTPARIEMVIYASQYRLIRSEYRPSEHTNAYIPRCHNDSRRTPRSANSNTNNRTTSTNVPAQLPRKRLPGPHNSIKKCQRNLNARGNKHRRGHPSGGTHPIRRACVGSKSRDSRRHFRNSAADSSICLYLAPTKKQEETSGRRATRDARKFLTICRHENLKEFHARYQCINTNVIIERARNFGTK